MAISHSGASGLSIFWSRRLSTFWRLQMYHLYGKINWGHRICLPFGGCPLFGGAATRGSNTVQTENLAGK